MKQAIKKKISCNEVDRLIRAVKEKTKEKYQKKKVQNARRN